MRRNRALLALVTTLVLLATGLSTAGARAGGVVAVRAEPGTVEASGVGADFLESYGGFEWAVVEERALGHLRATGRIQARRDAGTLFLPSATFDPLNGVPSVADGLEPGRPALHLVQFHGPVKDAWLDGLRSLGARIVQYLAPFSYAVLLDPADAGRVGALRAVRWVGAFDPAWRFGHLDLGDAEAANVVLLDDGRVPQTLALLEGLGAEAEVTARDLPYGDVDGVGVRVLTAGLDPAALAALPGAWSISPDVRGEARDEMSDQISAGNYDGQNRPQTGYRDWLQGAGLGGDGVTVALVDDGYDALHPDTQGTVAGCRDYGVPNHTCRPETGPGSDFHGQHTGGIVVGTGTVPATDDDGFVYGQGMAPEAKLFVQNYISLRSLFGYSGPGRYLRLNRDSVLGGATISANSWGPSGSPRGYDADTREFDHAPRDANLDTDEHEPLAFVLSIMNGRGGTSTQGTPDEGKNLIHVGSSKNFRAGQINDLSFSTAHGPMLDGRRLVDVVAPGERVVSTANPGTAGVCTTLQLDPLVSPWAGLYASCSGTSMASPHVSGAAALFTEWYREERGEDPFPALIKGAFVNGAVNLAGARDANGGTLGNIPDEKQGWGRMNLENVFGRTEKDFVNQSVLLTRTGETWTAGIEPVDPAQPVKVTLVWTDAPGHGLGGSTPAWVNDLDLRVTEGEGESAVTYLGNAFGSPSTGWSVPGGAADFKNNVENVYLQSAGGPLRVEVLAANLAGDGVPGNDHATDQDFALVVSNGRIVE